MTQPREMKLAPSTTQPSKTPGLAIVRTNPVMNAECGCSFCSMRSSMRCSNASTAGIERAMRKRTPKNNMNAKLNTCMAASTGPRLKNDAKLVKATAQ
jgi:hypothetical protein